MSSSPVSSLTSISAVEICDDDDFQLFHPSLLENMGKKVFNQAFDQFQYSCEEVLTHILQIKSPNSPLVDVCERYCNELLGCMC